MLKAIRNFFTSVGDFSSFAFRASFKGLRHPIRPTEMLEAWYSIGYQTLPVVLFAGLFAGLSQTLFLEAELDDYGAKMTIGRVLAITAIRELGPLVVSLMLIGKVGATIAAEIGSMKINNQIDAIIGLGGDPERKLASPRIWGMTTVALPIVLLTDVITVIGGWLVSTVGNGMFWYQAQMGTYSRHVTSTLTKPVVFGWMISTVACYYGLRCEGGVRGVGAAVSKTVVVCCIWLFILNALMGIVMIAWQGT